MIAVASFTGAGAQLAAHLARVLKSQGDVVLRHDFKGDKSCTLQDWTAKHWQAAQALVFIGATGIAVRAAAPFATDKLRDPAVVSIDEQGNFAVPLLGGHVGGANALAKRIAAICGAQPVISTATDLNGCFAVDLWAKQYGVSLLERELAKEASAALLDGKAVGLYSEFPVKCGLPEGISVSEKTALGVYIALDGVTAPFERTLHAVPRIVTIGAGCRKGVCDEVFERVLLDVLSTAGVSVHALCALATIDIKREEACMQNFCKKYGLEMQVFSAEALGRVPGDFQSSGFVKAVTGVDNVCERAAMAAGGEILLLRKQALDGVTVALAVSRWEVCFAM